MSKKYHVKENWDGTFTVTEQGPNSCLVLIVTVVGIIWGVIWLIGWMLGALTSLLFSIPIWGWIVLIGILMIIATQSSIKKSNDLKKLMTGGEAASTCPKCGTIAPGAYLCPVCSAQMPKANEQSSQPRSNASERRRCPECGNQVPYNYEYCPKCLSGV